MVMEVQLIVDEESKQFHTFFVLDGSLIDVEVDGVVEAAEVGEVRFFDVWDEIDGAQVLGDAVEAVLGSLLQSSRVVRRDDESDVVSIGEYLTSVASIVDVIDIQKEQSR